MSKKWIRDLAGDALFEKGYEIWENGDVLDLEIEDTKPGSVEEINGLEMIHALVRGSGNKVYQVHLAYDYFEDRPIGGFCECPVFGNGNSICKHCVAAFIEYQDRIDAEKDYDDDYDDEDDDYDEFEDDYDDIFGRQYRLGDYIEGFGKRPSTARKKGADKGRATSPVIMSLLDRQTTKKMLPLTQKETYGKVKLEPVLEETYRSLTVSFKIGTTRMYVLKDVFGFADRMRNMTRYAYGKQLEFVHTMEAFTPDSVKLVDFLIRWAAHNDEGYYYGYQYYGQRGRDLPLEKDELEDFLLCMGDREFEAHIQGMKETRWHVTGKELVRQMTLKGDAHGVTMSLKKMSGYVGNRYFIYFDKGKIYLDSQDKLEEIRDFVLSMGGEPTREAYINEKELPLFCKNLLPQLKKFYEIQVEDFDESKYGSIPAKFEIYLDAPQRDLITCSLKAVYGEEKFDVFGEKEQLIRTNAAQAGKRDILMESNIGSAVSDWFNAFDEKNRQMVLADDEEKMYQLLTAGIPALQQLGTVFISDTLKRYQVMAAPKVQVGVSVSGDMLDLSLSSQDLPLDKLAEILSKYERKKKFYRLKSGEFVNLEDEGVAELARMTKELGLSDAQLRKKKIELPRYRLLYLEEELSEQHGYEVSRDSYYKRLAQDTDRVMEQTWKVPESLSETMRDYQKTGFSWMLKITKSGFGGILADDMGLGKTLQVISVLLHEYMTSGESENRRTLIVTPASLVYNWESELERFAPGLPVVVVAGTAAQRAEQIKNASSKDILVTSYDLLKRDIEHYEQVPFYMEVIDEAQFIKNHTTQAAKAVKLIRAQCRLALTGTPIENRLSELWSIFDYLMPGFLYSYERFRREIEVPAIQGESEEAFERLRRMVHPFILRRLKEDVLKDLPEKIEENMFAKLTGEQQKLYDAHVQRLKLMLDKQSDEEFKTAKIQVLAELTRLRQLCCDPALIYEGYKESSAKSDLCVDLIENAIAGGHKILLFSQFTTMLERLEQRLSERGISYYTITGATPKDKRMNLVDSFNNNDVPVFCISLKAGGTGLNLASADIVIHFDPWWNLAVQNQATDRAHRIGQKNIVTVYKLIARGTIEENIVKLQDKKKALAEQLLSGEEMSSGNITREELLELLGKMA